MATLAQVDFLALILTSRCNFACSYCFQNDRKDSSMSWETLRRALELGLLSEKRHFHFYFTGGEPLLESGLIRRGVEFLEPRRRAPEDFSYELSTNGALVTPAISGFLDKFRFQVQISFDGVAEAQHLRSKGSFAVLDKLLDRLRLRHPELFENRLRVHITVSASGVKYLADSVAYLLDKECKQISIGSAFTPALANDVREELYEQFTRILKMSLVYYCRHGTIPVEAFAGKAAREKTAEECFLCHMQELNTLTVDTDGRAYACAFFAQSYQKLTSNFLNDQVRPLDLGPIDAPDFAEKCVRLPEVAANLAIFLHRSKKHSSYGRCGKCPYLAECTVCPVSIGQTPGNTDPDRVPDFLCAFNQAIIEHQRLFRRATESLAKHRGEGGLN